MYKFGVIGGSGLTKLQGMKDVEYVSLNTPFGKPSAPYVITKVAGAELCFLPRHGLYHEFSPSTVNYAANIYGFKKLGVQAILAVNAVGSLKEDIKPGDLVLIRDFFDRTFLRKPSFFMKDIVAHLSPVDVICEGFLGLIKEAFKELELSYKDGAKLVCIEGPSYSTKAESFFYKNLGLDVVGMTSVPEFKLAAEAGLCYAVIGMVTDYDCWKESKEEHVGHDMVVRVMNENAEKVRKIIELLASKHMHYDCSCKGRIKTGIATSKQYLDIIQKQDDILIQ